MSAHSQKSDVLILVGGKGTRLRSVVNDRPKPMVEINGQSFLDILLDYVSSFGYSRFILCTGYLADHIDSYYKGKELPYEIVLSKENSPLGTGGAVKNAEKYITTNDFLVMNGDSFCPVNLIDFEAFHHNKKSKISIAVTKSEDVNDYGNIRFDTSYRILSFEEKINSLENGYINTGIYFFNHLILKYIPINIKYSLEEELFPSLIGMAMFSYETDCNVIDIGTPERYKLAKKYFPG